MPLQVTKNETGHCLNTSSSGSPLRWESGRRMLEVDYLAECNAVWSGGEVGGYIGACCLHLLP
jgi:hypothetical protein